VARARFLLTANILFLIGQAAPSHAAPRDRFFWLSQINRASAVMIVERGIVPKPLGARIFDAINASTPPPMRRARCDQAIT
jgi:argininosuccinate lyase